MIRSHFGKALVALLALSFAATAQEPPANLAEEAERAKDEAEILTAIRETKLALVRAAEAELKRAEVAHARISKVFAMGAASREEIDGSASALDAAKAQILVRTAEAREAEVRLLAAKRRQERLAAAKAVPVKVVADTQADRLDKIIKQLQQLIDLNEALVKKAEELERSTKQAKTDRDAMAKLLDALHKDVQEIEKKVDKLRK